MRKSLQCDGRLLLSSALGPTDPPTATPLPDDAMNKICVDLEIVLGEKTSSARWLSSRPPPKSSQRVQTKSVKRLELRKQKVRDIVKQFGVERLSQTLAVQDAPPEKSPSNSILRALSLE